MTKRVLVFLTVLMLIVCSLSTFIITSGATSTTPDLSIDYCNLSFRDSVCIKYAVKSSVSDVKLLVWTEPQTEYTYGTQDYEITAFYTENIEGSSYMIFDFTSLVAKQMADVVYTCAYAEVDGVGYYSEVNKYSILQYAYNKLGKTAEASSDEKLKEMLVSMLEYGACAQKYLNYKTDRLANADWYQVKIEGGVLDDGVTHGLYLMGDKVTITAPETNEEGATFAYWADSKGNKAGTTAEFELTVEAANQTYTPVYVKYSTGFEFDSNGDGTCYIVGMGDCTDAELVIPPVSPDKDKVIGIDSNAFSGEALISVSFPNTIEEIGRRAFNGCDSLTDVYYDGTEEEWNENVNISAGNDAVENATKHFFAPAITTYTVTFVDYDGTVLQTEIVEEGASATAPEDPSRDGYTFKGWDKSFDNVTGDLTVTAKYIKNGVSTVVVNSVTAIAGDTVDVEISVENNTGFASLKFDVLYGDDLELTAVNFNSEICTNATTPEPYRNPQSISIMDPFKNIMADGTLVTLTFKISDNATVEDITIIIDEENTLDVDFNTVNFEVINGNITLE